MKGKPKKAPYPEILPRVFRDVVIADPAGDKVYFIPFNPHPPYYQEQEGTLFDYEIEDPSTRDLAEIRELLETGASAAALRLPGRTRYMMNIGSLQVSVFMHYVRGLDENGYPSDEVPPMPGFWDYRLQKKK